MKNSLSKRCVAELIGTFAIVFFGCGSIAILKDQLTAHFIVNVVFGLVVAAMIYALGHISAAHFNPAVTVGFAAGGHFPWREVPAYVFSQCTGAVVGSFFHFILLKEKAVACSYGATLGSSGVPVSVATEIILTFFLMLVIVSVATDDRAPKAIPGLAIGMIVTLCGLFGGPLSGCSMNPARSLGPAIFAQGTALQALWVYLIAPVVGSVFAVKAYQWLRCEDGGKLLK
jgi:aquaporin NIP